MHRLSRSVHLHFQPESDKPKVYAQNLRDLLADQIAFLQKRSHRREVVESDGLTALELADRARRIAVEAKS